MKTFHTRWAVIAAIIAFVRLAMNVAHSQSNLVLLIGATGEYVGQGQTYYTTNQTNMTVSATAGTVTISSFGFTVIFDAPGASNLIPGQYSNAVRYPFNGDLPGLSVYGSGRSCTNVCGQFEVLEIQTNAAGQLVNFWATFSQHCECAGTPLAGEVRYHSQLAPVGPLPRTLLVPDDFPTIQSALYSVDPFAVDTVLVQPGVYQESVHFGTNSAHLVSRAGPANTLIMGTSNTYVVSFDDPHANGTSDSLVSGFTITSGNVGVYTTASYCPVVVSNVIVNCGTGIYCNGNAPGNPWSAVLRGNSITNNPGLAVQFSFTGMPLLEANLIEANGGGIGMWQAGSPMIRNNIIRANQGDGFYMLNYSDPDIVQNLIIGNANNGIRWLTPMDGRGPYVINNTILGNGGAGISADGYDGAALIENNIIVGSPAIWVGNLNDITPPMIRFNNVYSRTGAPYSGLITNLTGISGNISTDPFFTCEPGQDFHLLAGSPCIDSGTNSAPFLLGSDLDGRPRFLPGTGTGSPVVDLGAYEFDASNAPVACLFLYCPTNMLVIAEPGQTSSVVSYAPAFATPGAAVSYSAPSGAPFPAGDDPVTVSAVYGTNVMSCGFIISVLTTDDYLRAVNATNLTWISSGDVPWFVEGSITRDGLAAAQSGAITDNQSSTLQATISGPGTLSFWWKVSSETNHDVLSLTVNGAPQTAISGEVDWQLRTIYLGIGPQTVRWTYAKDATGAAGMDAAWLDLVSYTPGLTPPLIAQQPGSQAQPAGQPGSFSVGVVGTPPLAFQWSFNGTALNGATQSTLVITNVRAANAGVYRVTINNAAGFTNSAAASLALAEVVSWGQNYNGQTNVPLNLSNILTIAAGASHAAALRQDGTMAAWGLNIFGQTNVPPGLSNVVSISAHLGNFTMALKSNGTVTVWGDDWFGEMDVPAGLTNVVAIAAGDYHCLALKAEGVVVSWGYDTAVPDGLSNVVSIAAGGNGSLALLSDGTVVSWGTPIAPVGLSNVVAIAAGGNHGLALLADGTVTAWGDNYFGQTNIPAGLSNVVAIAAGNYHNCALRADGTVAVWGSYLSMTGMVAAWSIPGLSNMIAIAAGSDHVVALLASGPPVSQVYALSPRWTGGAFSLLVPTQSGRTYRLEFQDVAENGVWSSLPLVPGTGLPKTLLDTNAVAPQRFYRVRRW